MRYMSLDKKMKQLYKSIILFKQQLTKKMGCAGSIDEQTIQYDIKTKTKLIKNQQIIKTKQQDPQIQNIKMCNINIGEYTCPFEYFLKKNIKFGKKYKTDESSSDQEDDLDSNTKLGQKERLQKQQKILNKKYQKIVKWIYGKSLNIQVKYYEQKQYKQKVNNILQINKLTTKQYKRYTPLYNRKVGIIIQNKNNKKNQQNILDQIIEGRALMNKQQFINKWNQVFQELKEKNSELKQFLLSLLGKYEQYYINDIIKQIRQFDLICYHTILSYVYNKKINRPKHHNKKQQQLMQNTKFLSHFNQNLTNYQQLSQKHLNEIKRDNLAYRYFLYMKSKFEHNIFNLQQKIHKIKKFIQKFKFDVVFMQEVSKYGLEQIRKKLGYYMISYSKNRSTIILINQALLQKLKIKKTNITLVGHNYNYLRDQIQQGQNKMGSTIKNSIILKHSTSMTPNKLDNINLNMNLNRTQQQPKTQKQISLENIVQQTLQRAGLKKAIKKLVKKKLPSIQTPQSPQIFFGQESVVQFIGQLILISAFYRQFNSNSVMKQLQKDLQIYKNKFPNHTIIIGFNSQYTKKINYDKTVDKMSLFRKNLIKQSEEQQSQQQDNKPLKLYFIPDIYEAVPGIFDGQKCVVDGRKLKKLAYNKGLFTSFRKKSHFCLSFYQSCQQYMGVDSFIISTNKINKSIVRDCDGNKIDQKCQFYKQQQYLPSLRHPFTDFFVCGQIDLQVQPEIYRNFYPPDQQQVQNNNTNIKSRSKQN